MESAPYGVIDIGSNTVHLLVARVAGPALEPQCDVSVGLQLGATVDATGAVGPAARDALVATLRDLLAQAAASGSRPVSLLATHAVRVAADRDAVAAAIEAATGRPLTVLPPEAEAALAFRGATAGLPPGAYAVVDIGGGSMQVAVGAPDAVPCTGSLPIGAAHLARRFLPGDPPAPADLARLRAYLGERIPPILPALAQAPAALLAAGGSARRLLALLGDAPGRLWPAAELGRLRARLVGRPAAALAAAYALEPERIPLLAPAVLILEEVARAYGGPAFAVALGGLREGVIRDAEARERRTTE